MKCSQRCFTLLMLLFWAASALAVETKEITFSLKHAAPVIFSHAAHLAANGNNCRVCHTALYNIRNRRHFTMADMARGKSCGACHNGGKAFRVTSGEDCVRCHKGKMRNLTYMVRGSGDVLFSHDRHLAVSKDGCESCHNSKAITSNASPVSMAAMEKGKTCGACHNGRTSFSVSGNCATCHKGYKPPSISFKTEAGDAVFSHDKHTANYACKECHPVVFPYRLGTGKQTMAAMEQGKSCGACHNRGKEAFPVQEKCGTCHKESH
ncbi:MAG: cytochrome c3 family protein [Desulfuromonadales bacterium]|nr:cytochrome c3 family protein [Desulfuromonadales bacterium]